jgi:hypothetical protein
MKEKKHQHDEKFRGTMIAQLSLGMIFRVLLTFLTLGCASTVFTSDPSQPWWNTSLSFQERIDSLISELTMLEKIALLDYDAPAIPRLGIPSYNYWSEGTHGVAFAGIATVFPSPLCIAASFEPSIANRFFYISMLGKLPTMMPDSHTTLHSFWAAAYLFCLKSWADHGA